MAVSAIRPLDYISTRNQTDMSRAPGEPGVHYNPLGILLFRDTFSVENSDLTKMCPPGTNVFFSVILCVVCCV